MGIQPGIFINGFDTFILIFIRMTGLFVISPIFGRRNIPVYLKIGFALLTALILVNTVTMPKTGLYDGIYEFGLLVVKEFIVGITIGFVSYLVFTAIYMAGQLIDMQVGFGMVNVIDPVSNIQVPLTSNFYFILSMMVFLAENGHHILIKALFESFTYVPLGQAVFNKILLDDIVRVFGDVLLVGFKISAPIVAAILITDIALGLISKNIPQLNVFVVGMPLKLMLGLIVLFVTIPMFVVMVDVLINGMSTETYKFIKDMVPK